MSDMKCVKCNSDLEHIGDFYACTNIHCPLCGNKKMWQELIRTRKALDTTVDALKEITNNGPCTSDIGKNKGHKMRVIFDMLRLFGWCILLGVLSSWLSFESTVLTGLAIIITDIRKNSYGQM